MVRSQKNFECFPEIRLSQRPLGATKASSSTERVRAHRKRQSIDEKVVISAITVAARNIKQGFAQCSNAGDLLASIPRQLLRRTCEIGENVMYIPYGAKPRSWERGVCEGCWFVKHTNTNVRNKWVVVRRDPSVFRERKTINVPIVVLPLANVFLYPRYFRIPELHN